MQDTNLEELLHKASSDKASKKKSENLNPIAREIIQANKMIYYGDSFFRYQNGRYSILNENQMKQIVFDTIKDAYRQSKAKEIQESMIAQCLVDSINIKSGVNVLNGVFDFETMTLIKDDHSYRFTTQVQAVYDPGSKCPRWESFLNEMLDDDPAKIRILQEYVGYSLDYSVNVEMIIFLLGRGANGKSVFCDAIKNVIGYGNYDTISLDDLKNKNYVAELLGKLINISTESQAKAEVYESNLKRLASGEEIKVDRKFKHPFSFKSNCKHIYSLNNLPRVGDKTDAFFRRIMPIPFNRQVEKDKRILGLGALIAKEEASGILNWMIEGYIRLKKNGWQFTYSQQVQDLLDEYRKDNNNVLNFVDEMCEFSPNQFVTNNIAYARYQTWCKESGVNPVKKKSFTSEIVDNFKHEKITREKIGGERGLRGIGLILLPNEPF